MYFGAHSKHYDITRSSGLERSIIWALIRYVEVVVVDDGHYVPIITELVEDGADRKTQYQAKGYRIIGATEQQT